MSAAVNVVFLVFLLALTFSILIGDRRTVRWLEGLTSVPVRDAALVPAEEVGPVMAVGPAHSRPTAGLISTLGRLTPDRLIGLLTLPRISWLPTIVFGAMLIVWAQFWSNVVQYTPDQMTLSSTHFISDWPMHIGDLATMVYGDNFPVEAPRVAGETYGYHYLATVTAAAISALGVLPGYALEIHSGLGMAFCLFALYAFGRRIFRRTGTAVLGTLIFFFGGSFAWLLTVRQFNATGDLWDTLRNHAWEFGPHNADGLFAWNQVTSYPFLAQRAFIYGIPLFLLIMTLLWIGLRQNRLRPFIVAGLVTGTLPYSNGSTALILVLVLPFLALLFPVRPFGRTPLSWIRAYPITTWVSYVVVAAALALPQILIQQSGGAAGLEIRWLPGWNLNTPNGPEPWWWYAIKNFGFLLIFIPLGFLIRGALSSSSWRLLLAIMPVFPMTQLIAFQPLAGDNAKLVMLWYLAGAMVAAAGINAIWSRARTAVPRAFLSIVVTAMLLTGVLIHVELIAQDNPFQIANREELALGDEIREVIPPDALVATNQRVNNPILMLGGRRILVGAPIHVWTHGYDAREEEDALRTIMRYGPDAADEIARYGVDYVAIAQGEIDDLNADRDAYIDHYPVVLDDGVYMIFAVSPAAIDLAVANGATLPTPPSSDPTPVPFASVSVAGATPTASVASGATRPPRT
ncbi:MAG TPA: hypothetical protein VGT61_14490 [Thermomicrobiales bacterium]|nr:hypothetical protein [Thermomicrobiales bacterium]